MTWRRMLPRLRAIAPGISTAIAPGSQPSASPGIAPMAGAHFDSRCRAHRAIQAERSRYPREQHVGSEVCEDRHEHWLVSTELHVPRLLLTVLPSPLKPVVDRLDCPVGYQLVPEESRANAVASEAMCDEARRQSCAGNKMPTRFDVVGSCLLTCLLWGWIFKAVCPDPRALSSCGAAEQKKPAIRRWRA